MNNLGIPKRIYLDTNDWIYLSQVHYGFPKDPELIEVYQKIKKLSDSGEAIFPISFSHLEDIMIRKDDASRNRLIDLIMDISKGNVLEPYIFHIQDEVVNAVAHRLGKITPIDIKSNILSNGIVHVMSRGINITWNKSKGDIPDELIQKLKEEANKPESMTKLLKEGGMAEYFQQDRTILDEAAKNMEKNRQEKLKLKKEERYDQAAAHFIYDIISPHLASLLITSDDEMKKKVVPQDKESMEKFLEDMPSTNISFRLTYARDEWYGREVQPNDIADINHLAGGVAYCDIVVTERAFGSLCKQQKLDKKYGCIVLNSLKDLNKIL